MNLLWDDLIDALRVHLKEADEHLYILSPFITKGIIDQILPDSIPTTIITSWHPDFLLKSPDAIDVFKECEARKDTGLYLNNRLHAKIYACDLTKKKNSAIVGSVNLTRKGLGLDPEPNYEVAGQIQNLNPKDRIYIQRILNDSILVTPEIFERYRDWIEKSKPPSKPQSDPVIELVNEPQLLVTHLPLTDSPYRLWALKSNLVEFDWWEEDSLIHDMSIFGGESAESEDVFLGELREGFLKQVFVREFLKIINTEGIFFGRIKEWIQTNCHDVPTPKRRGLTVTVQAMLRWVVELCPEKYEIIRPHHSECLKAKC